MTQFTRHPAPEDEEGRQVYPARKGDWVLDRLDPSRVARIRDINWDPIEGGYVVDLFLYGRDGEKKRRESPAMGGPTAYEPACSWKNWERIEKPEFPITLQWVDNGDGTRRGMYHSCAKTLPDRKWVSPAPRVPSAPAAIRPTDFDPRLEAASRRMAAEELRAAARKSGVRELADRAAELEQEAERISPRGI